MDSKVLNVTGMHCASCVKRVELALDDLDGVESVKADFETGIVSVDFDPAKVSLVAIESAITAEGFTVL